MAHGQRKRRRKIGSVSPDGRGGWYVRVSRGYRADGTRRTVNAHVEGTYEFRPRQVYPRATCGYTVSRRRVTAVWNP